jgi:hypothetical protein
MTDKNFIDSHVITMRTYNLLQSTKGRNNPTTTYIYLWYIGFVMVLNADAILISSGVDYKRAINGVQNAWTKTEIAVSEMGKKFYFNFFFFFYVRTYIC